MSDLIFIVVLFLAYFLPSVIAFLRGHESRWGIMLLNLFLGWTMLFWFISLIWSASASGRNSVIISNINN